MSRRFKAKRGKTIFKSLLHFKANPLRRRPESMHDVREVPIRSKLFSRSRMKSNGRTLAGLHKSSTGRDECRLLDRLAENENVLIGVRNILEDAVTANYRIAPAEQWLLDNFHLIEEQIHTARRHLPKDYSRELPRLLNDSSAGLPRVYDIAMEVISHGDGRVDSESLSSFVASYQTRTALTLGELWAIPIMLRLALIENLRCAGERIVVDRTNRNCANHWADQMAKTVEMAPQNLILVIAEMAQSNPPMVSSFVAEFTRRMQGSSPAFVLPLTWIEQQLTESGMTIDKLVQSENQKQAADQVAISNGIGSFRFLTTMDWHEFVETMSVVEQTLRADPMGAYGRMDFVTRDRYRHIVERLAKNSPRSEEEIARKAIQLALDGADRKSSDDREAHVGFYLIDKGLPQLERTAEVRKSISESIKRIIGRAPLPIYLGAITLITVLIAGGLSAKANSWGAYNWQLALIFILFLLGGSQLAVALVNWLATFLVKPHLLPRMDFAKGIPPESRTLVVIPTLLTSAKNLEDLTEALEVRFLANQDQNLYFGLLTDFLDAQDETLPEDRPLLDFARKEIEELNRKYGNAKGAPFFLFHRPRRWNPGERIWMGYERKRGKLADLNSLLRGGTRNHFSAVVGDTKVLSNIKYVITLDTDTQLPRDSAWQLVGTMAHPLNRARYDEKKQRICEGYGILQPRVVASLSSVNRSWYARLFGSEAGIDPYTRAVSDVYQDLFREGSYIGKGIYDVDVFEEALKGHFPENRILSHDLLEGCYARSGLLSDVQLVEEYPSQYSMDVGRRHRWIRGDWQIASWLLPRVPGPGGAQQRNPIGLLSAWKIFDNLRRSMVSSALVLLLLLGWTVLSSSWFWTLSVIGMVLIPSSIASIVDLIRKPSDVLLWQHLTTALRKSARHFAQSAFILACLPYEALFSIDAIARFTGRMLFTRRNFLEWSPAVNRDQDDRTGMVASCRTMGISTAVATATAIFLALSRPSVLGIAGPILAIWFASPIIAWWISRPLGRRPTRLTADQTIFLHTLSRKTWAFFETFIGPEDHWLPPDNFQEHPAAFIAHRTSPTNMGLALLANLAAYDFGYISALNLIKRTESAFNTMEDLERYQGHFYNWYDTKSLKPLLPAYVSSVDSGNLAGFLLTLRPGLIELLDHHILAPRFFDGFDDTLRILVEVAAESAPAELAGLQSDLASTPRPTTLTAARKYLDMLAKTTATLVNRLDVDPGDQMLWWTNALNRQCRGVLDDLIFLAPWLSLSPPEKPSDKIPGLDEIPTLRELAELDAKILPVIEQRLQAVENPDEGVWLVKLRSSIVEGSRRAKERIADIENLERRASQLSHMDYGFLYDKSRHLLAIGYNVTEHRRDSSYYDLLASEARLASFVTIAQGQLPQNSWFSLGRLLTSAGGDPILLSWGGSMFEYLMPMLVMPTYENTLLDQTCKAVVNRQIEYGKMRGVPWGISESGYNAVDVNLNYQYRAFGIPGLGLRRGLSEDLVIAPYASALALMVAPEKACLNLQRLSAEGFEGRYGFYEAIDYTSLRQPRGQSSSVVRSFMAHHQGMSILSLAYLLLDRPMQKRFASDPIFRATLLLLQERIPKTTEFFSQPSEPTNLSKISSGMDTPIRVSTSPDSPIPELQLLSNGRYHVMVTNAGGGYSRWKNIAVTRWREDSTCDNWGMFCYIRDIKSGDVWSTAYHPIHKRPEKYEAILSEARVEFRRRDHDIETYMEIAVSPEDDIDLRRITLTNRSPMRRVVDLTSYAEVVLAPPSAEVLHPAFNNLFVQTEIISQRRAILCTRRPRSMDEPTPWMFHLMSVQGTDIEETSYETDRLQFIGRGNTVANPQAMFESGELSGSQGSVLDPIVAIRHRITLDPEESVSVNVVSGISETRETCLELTEKYQDLRLADRVFELSWTHNQVALQQINITEADAQLYESLAGSILYANGSLRADPGVLATNHRGQSDLWGYTISGDLPIVLLRIENLENIDLVRQLVHAHAYWRFKGLAVDLVIWNEDHAGYRQLLHDQIMELITTSTEASMIGQPGGIFVRAAEQMSNEDRILFQSVAHVIIADSRGSLEDQINHHGSKEVPVDRLVPSRISSIESPATAVLPRRDLIFANERGGFTRDGREYVISTAPGQLTPSPWVNVLANPQFGTVISESGSACTWSENAHEFRLTPWNNDPVSDSSGEAFYIRDEETGHFWSPTPLPSRGAMPYASRHGFGYSVFEHTEHQIHSELTVFVALDAPVKFSILKVRNETGRARRLSVTGYVEWVLGELKTKSTMHVITEIDPDSGGIFARNSYNTEFANRVAFFDMDDATRTVSCDRTEFLGRNGTLRSPAAMFRERLSGKMGAALDPCAAIQVPFELADGEEREFIFMLGVGQNPEDARKLVNRFRGSAETYGSLQDVWQYWNHTLGAVHVETPDKSLNILTNGWLLYQTLACRLWARSAFYQPGGAFGFRDQLQDVMAFIHSEPQLMREHLLRAASRQFQDGDVQHWWHPPSGRGVRTRCSDDYLWLPLATFRYVSNTGDTGVLDEPVHFLEGRRLNDDEESYYDLPARSEETAGLYEHCVRAIKRALKFGDHGLPLIGSGDWNDGMNLVGEQGKGESIWLGFFLYEVLTCFTELAGNRGDDYFAERCRIEADQVRRNIEKTGWDGAWYRRAYFDDGSPLGSAINPECQIDSIAQSWAVLSGGGDAGRSRMAMESVYKLLVFRDHALVQLLDPPFDKSNLNPGYIKGYVPGVRENGGQYTHGAIWAAMAFAALGDSQRAWELLSIINPINHARTSEAMAVYKVEPYVVAADVYSRSPHTGRGGWTWYTGSAGWMYRLIVESILGLRLEVDKLRFVPCLPADWKEFKIHYRCRETTYHIAVMQTYAGKDRITVIVDGVEQNDETIPLVDDRQEHSVDVKIFTPQSTSK